MCSNPFFLDSWMLVFPDILFPFFPPFLCVCKAFVCNKRLSFIPSEPGSCVCLSPFLLCAGYICVLVCMCLCVWKQVFLKTIKPRKFWSKFPGNTLSDATRDLRFFLRNVSLRWPHRATRHYCDLCVPCSCLYSQTTPLKEQVDPCTLFWNVRLPKNKDTI